MTQNYHNFTDLYQVLIQFLLYFCVKIIKLFKGSKYIFRLLSVVIALFQLKQVFIIGHFFVYQNEITTEFCKNKDNPELKWGGKCHLVKELAELDKNNVQLEVKTGGQNYLGDIGLSIFPKKLAFQRTFNLY